MVGNHQVSSEPKKFGLASIAGYPSCFSNVNFDHAPISYGTRYHILEENLFTLNAVNTLESTLVFRVSMRGGEQYH